MHDQSLLLSNVPQVLSLFFWDSSSVEVRAARALQFTAKNTHPRSGGC